MADYRAWQGVGEALGAGGDAYKQAKAAAQAKKMEDMKLQEETPSFDASALFGANAAPGLKATRGEMVKGLEKQAELRNTQKLAADAKASDKNNRYANQYRDEFNNLSKSFQTVVPMYGNIRTNAALGEEKSTAASDMSMIFAYMKLLDPNSTVREGEYANAAKAGTFGDEVKNAMQRFDTGQKLTAEQRVNFANAARDVFRNANQVQGQHVSRYKDLAKRSNVNPEDVIYDYGSQYAGDLADDAKLPWMQQQGGSGNADLDAAKEILANPSGFDPQMVKEAQALVGNGPR